jgi:site-specific recombinase XerD
LKRPKKNWQPDPFSDEEMALVLDSAKRGSQGTRNYAIVCFLYDSGIRNAELCNLLPDDVSIKTGQVRVRHGKGDKQRTILIGKLAKQAL